jgi:hypothetical protein
MNKITATVILLAALFVCVQSQSKPKVSCVSVFYTITEGNGNRCSNNCDCSGRRTCSQHNYCAGAARTKEEDECFKKHKKEKDRVKCIKKLEDAKKKATISTSSSKASADNAGIIIMQMVIFCACIVCCGTAIYFMCFRKK